MGGHLALVAAPSGDGILVCASPVGEQGAEPLRQRTGLLGAIFHSLNEGVMALDARTCRLARPAATAFCVTPIASPVLP